MLSAAGLIFVALPIALFGGAAMAVVIFAGLFIAIPLALLDEVARSTRRRSRVVASATPLPPPAHEECVQPSAPAEFNCPGCGATAPRARRCRRCAADL